MSDGDRTLSTRMAGIEYSVRRSERARRVRVTVDHARGVEVVLPARVYRGGAVAAQREAAAAVAELRPWIERRLAEQELSREVIASRGDAVPYLGTTLTLRRQVGRSQVRRVGDVLLVPGAAAERTPALERWYRRAARREIAPRLDDACAEAGLSYTRLTIRAQRTRWASCSRTGAMSFNWRLLLAPEPVLDYVVWHEVCHLQVMDHSPRFWALLASHRPGYKEQQRWLRRHGSTLVL
jgi:predicted metal-dependent hydrolase